MYSFLIPYKNLVYIDYIDRKARQLADNENIIIESISFEELNKNIKNDSDKAVGIFDKENNMIGLTEKSDVFVLLHELGHYFLHKRGKNQSEYGANLYIEEFFNTYLPPFFKWIYRIEICARSNKKIKYSEKINYEYWLDYINFKEN